MDFWSSADFWDFRLMKSTYLYAELSYNQLSSLLYALRNEASGTKDVLDDIIFSVFFFNALLDSLRLFLINRHD